MDDVMDWLQDTTEAWTGKQRQVFLHEELMHLDTLAIYWPLRLDEPAVLHMLLNSGASLTPKLDGIMKNTWLHVAAKRAGAKVLQSLLGNPDPKILEAVKACKDGH
jgi:hypothetical protein